MIFFSDESLQLKRQVAPSRPVDSPVSKGLNLRISFLLFFFNKNFRTIVVVALLRPRTEKKYFKPGPDTGLDNLEFSRGTGPRGPGGGAWEEGKMEQKKWE
jgi:hypothetical protein